MTDTEKTTPTVCIVESLDFLDEDIWKEGEIIFRTLRLADKAGHYSYLRNKAELKAFVKEFGSSEHRYLHVSCHGSEGYFHTTLDPIKSAEFARILKPHLNGRRLFLSTCLATDSKFAEAILKNSECLSVLGPVDEIDFDDAAIFWSSFYHLMFKSNDRLMQRSVIQTNVIKCANLVGQQFRFFYKNNGKIREKLLGPNSVAEE